MDPRPIPMAHQTTIHTAAATSHPTLTTASGPQTGQMTMVLAATTIHMAATTGRRILAALMGHQT